ncbi:F-box/LRR-repeat protein At3g48880-like [Tasmannia lanceolata]|uniref:F-box/LRR-repeat protein At3g48880-like n=1 Tax=Tasmannia lanceolata TaxID=3420 RepID=UPI004063297D
MEEMEDRKWEDLDMDCLVNVFGRLGLEEMILSVPFVCQSWYKASTNPLCWKVLNFIPLNLSDWDASDFEGRFMREYRLQKYSFTGLLKFVVTRSRGSAVVLKFPAEDVNLDNIIYVSDECLGLKCLALPRLDRRFLPELVGKWKHLEILLLQGMPSCISEMIKVINNHCKNFVGLKASGWVDDNVASAIVMFLPKIKYLVLSASTLSKENLMVILEGCKQGRCQEFCTRGAKIIVAELVGKLKHLEILLLEVIPDSFTEILQVISNHCKNFVNLKASGWVDDNVASAIVMFLPKIKYLNLSASTLSKKNLMVILEGCKDLELLYLKNCVGFDVDEEILNRASHIRDFNCEGAQLEEDFLFVYDNYDDYSDDYYQLSHLDLDYANSD